MRHKGDNPKMCIQVQTAYSFPTLVKCIFCAYQCKTHCFNYSHQTEKNTEWNLTLLESNLFQTNFHEKKFPKSLQLWKVLWLKFTPIIIYY